MLRKINLKQSNKKVILIAVLCITIGACLLGYNYFLSKKNKVYEQMTFALSGIPEVIEDNTLISDSDLSDSDEVIDNISNNNNPEPEVKPKPNTSVSYNYIGYLDIPKISLKKGFVDINSKYNNVNRNVAIMDDSSYPDVENGLFVLAAHNGTCWNCYFKNLNKLVKDDSIYVYYKDIKYTYKLVDIYEVTKTGKVSIYRDTTKTTLALITCTWNTKTKQTVFIAELINQEDI